ncbi:iron-sulfur cluster carrier protein ApbC [Pseudoalteromonas sp. McH1-7]|uniref:iron-sulfur cluster carrier protein ApbC n=1 Tax=Pseudoalteromonas sp. McH1-7 TaxID=2745574 RepID=UPI001590506E|nr:iron-sulfur cluster carrier protein ApbC [Pseudoalteromonas sp. McH1-7]NUZ10383.1 iron-sulfur cluster carrier protein ApbC [Pseudoalteromonas sp. McH1-7]
MFGLEKWFARGKNTKQAIIELLSGYRSAALPVGIDANWVIKVQESNKQIQVHINFPFAIQCDQEISSYLKQHLNKPVEVISDVIVVGRPKFKAIKHIILVASGKGGVGKSTTAINLAYALRAQGAKVGVLDADIYGPSLPSLLALEDEKPQAKDDKTLLPIEKAGIKAMSIGFLVPAENATVWRGPMASQALTQLLNETEWGELDYLIVDMPPGTGDIQLTMTQKVPASGAVIVTTPQTLALADAQKGIAMFEKVQLPILGLVENMSYFNCEQCGSRNQIFGHSGGTALASRYGVPLLAEVPLNDQIRVATEQGKDIVALTPQPNQQNETDNHDIADHYVDCAQLVASMLYYQSNSTSGVEIVMTED